MIGLESLYLIPSERSGASIHPAEAPAPALNKVHEAQVGEQGSVAIRHPKCDRAVLEFMEKHQKGLDGFNCSAVWEKAVLH